MNPPKNKTGLAAAPERARPMIEGRDRIDPTSANIDRLHDRRRAYAAEPEIFGTMAPPEREVPDVPPVLLDRLGERLAFERTGVRLYDTLLLKYDAKGSFDGGPSRAELQQYRNEELQHFRLLEETVEELGGDPTAVTPGANLAATEAMGILEVVSDPRMGLADSLHAMLVAELVDNVSWEHLIQLSRGTGHEELVERLEHCRAQEEVHLRSVKQWLAAHDSELGQEALS